MHKDRVKTGDQNRIEEDQTWHPIKKKKGKPKTRLLLVELKKDSQLLSVVRDEKFKSLGLEGSPSTGGTPVLRSS